MLVHPDHVSTIQTALLGSREKADGTILFHCSDGKIEVKSTFLKLHSKMLKQIILDVPFDQKEVPTKFFSSKSQNKHTVLLLDVPKSHISHLMNIITFGNSKFSGTNKSEMESMTNEVLNTAAHLDINISNYVLDLEDGGQLVQNTLNSNPDPEQEYCEFPDERVKQSFEGCSDEKSVVKSSSEIDKIGVSDVDDDIIPINNFRKEFISNLNNNIDKHAVNLNRQTRLQKRNAEQAALVRQKQKSKLTILDPSLTKFVCVYSACGGQFRHLHQLRRHQFSDHWRTLVPNLHDPTAAVNCALCHKEFPQNLIGAHMLGFHEKKKLTVPCFQCGDMFSQHDVFFDHMTGHVNDDRKPSQQDPINLNPSVDESISIPEVVPPIFGSCHRVFNPLFSQTASNLNALPQQTSSVVSAKSREVSSSTIQPTNPLPEGSAQVRAFFAPSSPSRPSMSSSEALSDASTSKTIWLRSDLMIQKAPVIRPGRFKVPATQDSTPIFKFTFPAEVRIPENLHFSGTQSSDPKSVPVLFRFGSPVPISASAEPEVSNPNTSSSKFPFPSICPGFFKPNCERK